MILIKVMELAHLGEKLNAGGGCDATVNARTRCRLVKPRECSVLLYGRRIPLKAKWMIIRVMQGQQYCMQVTHKMCFAKSHYFTKCF